MNVSNIGIYDESSKYMILSGNKSNTIDEILKNTFPNRINENISIEVRYENYTRKIVKKNLNFLSLYKIKHLSRCSLTFHIVNLDHYIDVFFNKNTRLALNITIKTYRIYCNKNTRVKDVEFLLNKIFISKRNFGVFGFEKNIDDELIFKLKPNDNVLELKEIFKHMNFFQYQIYGLEDTYIPNISEFQGHYYKLKSPDDHIWYKKSRIYKIKQKNLLQYDNNTVRKIFYDICESKVLLGLYHEVYLLFLENKDDKWILRAKRNLDIINLYNMILNMKRQTLVDSHFQSSENDDFISSDNKYSKIHNIDQYRINIISNQANHNEEIVPINKTCSDYADECRNYQMQKLKKSNEENIENKKVEQNLSATKSHKISPIDSRIILKQKKKCETDNKKIHGQDTKYFGNFQNNQKSVKTNNCVSQKLKVYEDQNKIQKKENNRSEYLHSNLLQKFNKSQKKRNFVSDDEYQDILFQSKDKDLSIDKETLKYIGNSKDDDNFADFLNRSLILDCLSPEDQLDSDTSGFFKNKNEWEKYQSKPIESLNKNLNYNRNSMRNMQTTKHNNVSKSSICSSFTLLERSKNENHGSKDSLNDEFFKLYKNNV